MSLYIPPIVKVGSIEREDTFEGKLSFVIPSEKSGKKFRQQEALDGWLSRNIHVGTEVFDNVPTNGFFINKSIKRVSYSSFGSTTNKMRIYANRGFEFEIDMANVAMIATSCDISKGEILGNCILAWDGKNIVVLPVASVEYMEYMESKKAAENHKSNLKSGDVELKVGDIVETGASKNLNVYVGKYNILSNDDIYRNTKRKDLVKNNDGVWEIQAKGSLKHHFANFYNEELSEYITKLGLSEAIPTGKSIFDYSKAVKKFNNLVKKHQEENIVGNKVVPVFDTSLDIRVDSYDKKTIYALFYKMKEKLSGESNRNVKMSAYAFSKKEDLLKIDFELSRDGLGENESYIAVISVTNETTGQTKTVEKSLQKRRFRDDDFMACRNLNGFTYSMMRKDSYRGKSFIDSAVSELNLRPTDVRNGILIDIKEL